jgi:hypothetical protein
VRSKRTARRAVEKGGEKSGCYGEFTPSTFVHQPGRAELENPRDCRDSKGRPLSFTVTGGQVHDSQVIVGLGLFSMDDDEDYRTSANVLGQILGEATQWEICAVAVRRAVNIELGEEDTNKPISRSLYRYLLDEMAKAVTNYASEKKIDQYDFESLLNDGLTVVSNLRSSLLEDWKDKSLNFWDNQANPIYKIKTGKVPYIDRSSVESVVGGYLALPFRAQAIDRFLVRILVAMELYAFGDEMLNEKTFGLFPARSPLKQRHALLAYLRGLLVNGVLFGGIGAFAVWANSSRWISESSMGWIVGICVALFLLFAVIGTIALPGVWYKQGKARRQVLNLLTTMATIYTELQSDGPISAQHIRARANDATQQGVVWPAPLFALLDDITARTGRF